MIVLPWLIAFGSFVALFVIYRLEGFIVSEVQDAVDAVTAQVVKARGEIVAAIADLEAKVAAGEPVDLTALKAAVQSVDDIVPDPAPVDVPPADTPVE